MLKESLRVLKVGGVNFTIALGKLKDRLPHYQRPFLSWDLHWSECFDKDYYEENQREAMSHRLFIATKKQDSDEVSKREFKKCLQELEKQTPGETSPWNCSTQSEVNQIQ